MAVNFSNTLIVAISASALFDLTEAEQQFSTLLEQDRDTAAALFIDYMKSVEHITLKKGAGFPLIEALLNLNQYQDSDKAYHDESPLVEVVIVSKSTPDLGIQVLNSIRAYGLGITRSAFISGAAVSDYIHDFDVDLFLTTNKEDAQAVADAKLCACAILDAISIDNERLKGKQLRIAFDGDAVLFDDSGELVFQQQGLQAFHEREYQMTDLPIDKGPYADLLIKLSALQKQLPHDALDGSKNLIQIALVTARNAPADMRAIKTLRQWGVNVDFAFFLGGIEKTRVLRTFAPHIFFDDSIKHIDAAKSVVPSGRVPYHSDSLLNQYQAKNDKTKPEIPAQDVSKKTKKP